MEHDAPEPTAKEVADARAESAKEGRAVLIVLAVLAVGGLLYFLLWNSGKASAERDDLALQMANVAGDRTCVMAWIKADGDSRLGDRTPALEPATVLVRGSPKVIDCPMLNASGRTEAMRVLVRCNETDLDCVEPQF